MEFDLSDTKAPGKSAVDELAKIMASITAEPGFAEQCRRNFDDVLTDIPSTMSCRIGARRADRRQAHAAPCGQRPGADSCPHEGHDKLMRIQNLSLDLFGKFTGKTFDFGKGDTDCDFHVIYGLNEAGKTTTMQGYLRLLYGFPQRDPYDFRHGRPNLKVSGTLQLGGDVNKFSRLTTRTGNLVDASNTAVTENAILALLGGLSSDDYRSLLCLDDDTIEKGGEDIVKAKGDIGRLLFSAAAGIADLNEVLEQAHTTADELYRKRRSKTRMAELKRGLSETDERIRMMDVPAHKLKSLKAKLKSAEQEEKRGEDGTR